MDARRAPLDVDAFAAHAGSDETGTRGEVLAVAEPPGLRANEHVLAGPHEAALTRVGSDGLSGKPIAGSVYLTNQRLVHRGTDKKGPTTSIDLARITELGLTASKVLLTLQRSRGVILDLTAAQEFRAMIADALSALRMGKTSELVPVMASGLGPVADAELVEDVADVTADRPR